MGRKGKKHQLKAKKKAQLAREKQVIIHEKNIVAGVDPLEWRVWERHEHSGIKHQIRQECAELGWDPRFAQGLIESVEPESYFHQPEVVDWIRQPPTTGKSTTPKGETTEAEYFGQPKPHYLAQFQNLAPIHAVSKEKKDRGTDSQRGGHNESMVTIEQHVRQDTV